jgi:hypothetical protein
MRTSPSFVWCVAAVAGLSIGAVKAPAAGRPLTLPDVLAKAGAYVTGFEQQLSAIVAEERYEQVLSFPKARTPTGPIRRRLTSDLLLVRPPGATAWFQFRDVLSVDGEPVRDRDDRLVKLFVDPPATVDDQIRRILAEGARYNVGALLRNVNAPVLPLQFLEPKNQERFRFKRTSEATPADMTTQPPAPPGRFRIGTEVWAIQFSEQREGTMIRTTAKTDLPARGRFWVEPDTGRVLMTELVLQDRHVRGVITVNYQSEPLVGMLVPIEMRERYDRLRDRSVIDGFAEYGRFRQFHVRVDETFAPIIRE